MLAAGCTGTATFPEPPGLRDLDLMADAARRDGLLAAWSLTIQPEAPPPLLRRGLAVVLLTTPSELDVLRAAAPDAAARRGVDSLQAQIERLQLAADPAVVDALRRIHQVRARRTVEDQIAFARIMTEEPNEGARRASWLAFHAAGPELAPFVRELTRSRKEVARRRWGTTALEMARRLNGVDARTVERLRSQVLGALRPRRDAPTRDPWDVEAADPPLIARLSHVLDESRCLERGREALMWAGLPSAPHGLVVVENAPGGAHSAFATFAMAPPEDVRVVVRPGSGLFHHWSVLHEFGHAAQALLAPRTDLRVLRVPCSAAVAEGCAKIFERLVYAPEWLKRQHVPDEDVLALARWEAASERSRAADILVDAAFEEVLDRDPDGDLDSAFARLQREIAGVAVPSGPHWALERSLVFEPWGRLDYLLARCAQASIYRRLRALPDGLLGGEASRVLRDEVMAGAAGSRYEEWFERAAGEPASCTAWLEDVARTQR